MATTLQPWHAADRAPLAPPRTALHEQLLVTCNAVCAACHGQDGAGREDSSAPGLVWLDDWYIVAQLRLYAAGLRGAHAEDTYGQQMRAMASLFADDAARRDVAAFIGTLAP